MGQRKGNKKINKMELNELRQNIKRMRDENQTSSTYYQHLLDQEQAMILKGN